MLKLPNLVNMLSTLRCVSFRIYHSIKSVKGETTTNSDAFYCVNVLLRWNTLLNTCFLLFDSAQWQILSLWAEAQICIDGTATVTNPAWRTRGGHRGKTHTYIHTLFLHRHTYFRCDSRRKMVKSKVILQDFTCSSVIVSTMSCRKPSQGTFPV